MHAFGADKINNVYDYDSYDYGANNSTSNVTHTVPTYLNDSVHYDITNMSMEEMFNQLATSDFTDFTLDDFKIIFEGYQNIHEDDPNELYEDHCKLVLLKLKK